MQNLSNHGMSYFKKMSASSQCAQWKVGLLTLVMVALQVVAPQAIAGSKEVNTLKKYFTDAKTLQADFSQLVVDEKGFTIEQKKGTVAIMRPGKFRWDYHGTAPQTIASDGDKMWLYDYELKQVTVRPVDEALAASPAALLSGSANVTKDFNIETGEAYEDVIWLKLSPKQDSADLDYQDIQLGFNNGELFAMRLKDNFNQTTEIQFFDIQVNNGIPLSVFAFNVPRDVDIVGNAGTTNANALPQPITTE